jgi:3',5'-cyclic AMP phosphodiesterase CpdA
MPHIADMIHASDLHFVESLTETGRLLWQKGLVKSHAFGRVDAFSLAVHKLWPPPDILLVTGDVCTDGSSEALTTALEFIEEDRVYRGTPSRLATRGLNRAREQRVILPGNHDRYSGLPYGPMQRDNDNLEAIFNTPPNYPDSTYPWSVGYRRPVHGPDQGVPSLLFFVFDSTASVIAREHHFLHRTWAYGAARGRIERAECDWLVDEADRIARAGLVTKLDGETMSVEYDTAVRIAVLHHHPLRTGAKSRWPADWTLMEQSELFVEACLDAKMDLVLFGHQHQTYSGEQSRNGHRIRFFCCPSTAEYSAKDAGFYLFSFHTDHFEKTLFRWRDPVFRGSERRSYVYSR